MSKMSKNVALLADYRKDHTQSVRDELIKEYTPLIRFIAKKIARRLPSHIELDDLISSGTIGLMDAINKFDSERFNQFKTYAEHRIRGAILDELRAQDWVPRSVRDKEKLFKRAHKKLTSELQRHPTDDELCGELDLRKRELHKLRDTVKACVVLNIDNQEAFSGKDIGKIHRHSEAKSFGGCPSIKVNAKLKRDVLEREMEGLPEKIKNVLSLYYFKDLNLKEVAAILSMSESRASQLHSEGISKLKDELSDLTEIAEGMAA
jgi:RNA polymerase sigma factor FliA